MAGIFAALYQIVWRLNAFESDGTKKEFWLFRFPFSLHIGWIIAAFVLNLNVFSVADPGAVGHPALIYLSLLALVTAAVYALIGFPVPDYTIPSVLAWATVRVFQKIVSSIHDSISDVHNHCCVSFLVNLQSWALPLI